MPDLLDPAEVIAFARAKLSEPGLSDAQRESIEEDLRSVDGLYERNPLERFQPHPKQRAYLEGGRVPTKMFAGGNRAGKTTVGVVDDLIQAVDRESLPPYLREFKCFEPPFYCRIVTEDLIRTMGNMEETIRKWVPTDQLRGGSWEKAYDKKTSKLRFSNGSWFDLSLSYEADVGKFSGVALHRVHFDEEPPGEKGRQIHQECRWRLVDYEGQILFTMTPLLGMSWTYTDIYERRVEPDFLVVQADIDENPHMSEEAKRVALDGLSDLERKARKQGLFVHFKGLVYPEFDEDLHLVDPPGREHVQGLTTIVGIDPGIRWAAVVWCGFDSDNVSLTYDELCLESHTVDRVAEKIRAKNERWGVKPLMYVIDPSARNRQMTNAEQVEAAFMREGIMVAPGQAPVEAGVLEMKRRLQHVPPAALVSRDCTRLRWEHSRYRMDPKADGAFAVVKEDDHEEDAWRYAHMERPWFSAQPVKERRRPGWIPGTDREPGWASPKTESAPLGSFS